MKLRCSISNFLSLVFTILLGAWQIETLRMSIPVHLTFALKITGFRSLENSEKTLKYTSEWDYFCFFDVNSTNSNKSNYFNKFSDSGNIWRQVLNVKSAAYEPHALALHYKQKKQQKYSSKDLGMASSSIDFFSVSSSETSIFA